MPATIGNPIEANSLSHLDGLDDYSLMQILDMLELIDLANVATLSTRCQQLIVDHYIKVKYRWHEKKILLHIQSMLTMEYRKAEFVHTRIATDYDEVLIILKAFGHIFKDIDIQIISSGYKYVEEIQSFVNAHCSNAVQKIDIFNHHIYTANDGFPTVNMSFANATDIRITTNDYFPNDPFRLDKAFPQMQKLQVGCSIDLHHHYPHLTNVMFYILYMEGRQAGYNPRDLPTFLRLNPQLSRIESPAYNISSYLPNLSELPNLQSLSLRLLPRIAYGFAPQPITRFRHVKDFSVQVDSYGEAHNGEELQKEILASIQFDQLESFSVKSYNPANLNFLIETIVKNTALRTVEINAVFTFEQLATLVASLPQLNELNIIWKGESSGLVLNEFLEYIGANNHSLHNINVDFNKYKGLRFENLLRFIPSGWSYSQTIAHQSNLLQLKSSN